MCSLQCDRDSDSGTVTSLRSDVTKASEHVHEEEPITVFLAAVTNEDGAWGSPETALAMAT